MYAVSANVSLEATGMQRDLHAIELEGGEGSCGRCECQAPHLAALAIHDTNV
jgi:hypothetical protein